VQIEFQWDREKARANLYKHGVSFEEAATIFADSFSLTIHDLAHSNGACRYVTIGLSLQGRTLVVVHTERGHKIRIISARKATARERKFHEEK
jgi:uncharacterized protein